MRYCALLFCLAFAMHNVLAVEEKVPARFNSTQIDKDRWYWWAAKLRRVALMRSKLRRESVTLTVVVPLSLERLQPLEFQCQLHHDNEFTVFAGALYIPIFQNKVFSPFSKQWNGTDVEETISKIQEFHDKATKLGCILDLALWLEELPEPNDWYTYPNNALRNKALQLAETEVVALMDADFILGPRNFGNQFQRGLPMYEAVMELLHNKTVLVMPAFDCTISHTRTQEVSSVMHEVTTSKDDLLSTPSVKAFQKIYHENTDYDLWMKSDSFYYVPYLKPKQNYVSGYEPYILALKKGLPCYDERFRGYYYNKCSFLYYIHRLGYQFAVHPDAYVIHYPHAMIDKMAQRDGKRRLVLHHLMSVMGEEITAGKYKPFVQDGSCKGFFE